MIILEFKNIFHRCISQIAGVKLQFQIKKWTRICHCYCLFKWILYIREKSRSLKPFVCNFLPVFTLGEVRQIAKYFSCFFILLPHFTVSYIILAVLWTTHDNNTEFLCKTLRLDPHMPFKHAPHFTTRNKSSRHEQTGYILSLVIFILSSILFTNLFLPQSHILSSTALRDGIWNLKPVSINGMRSAIRSTGPARLGHTYPKSKCSALFRQLRCMLVIRLNWKQKLY